MDDELARTPAERLEAINEALYYIKWSTVFGIASIIGEAIAITLLLLNSFWRGVEVLMATGVFLVLSIVLKKRSDKFYYRAFWHHPGEPNHEDR